VRGVHYFTKKSASELAEIVRELTLLEVGPNTKLVATGSKAATFYVILQGAARVYMPIDEVDDDGDASQDQGVSAGMANTHVLEDGDSFSEQGTRLSPSGKDYTRKMEVIAARHTLLLVLERSALDASMIRLREGVLQRHTDKLRDVFAFSDWKTDDLRRLAAVVTKRKFNKGVAIVQQGQRVLDSMFFLCVICQLRSMRFRTTFTIPEEGQRVLDSMFFLCVIWQLCSMRFINHRRIQNKTNGGGRLNPG